MSGSFGKVVIPVVSTCDPTGFNQAKAGLKELESAQGTGGGGAGGGSHAPRSNASAPNPAIEHEQSAWRNAMQHEGSFLASSQTFSGLESAAAKNRARLADLSPFGKTARVELSQQAAAMAAEHEKARKSVRGGAAGGRLGIGEAASGAMGELGMGPLAGASTIGGAAVGMYAISQAAATSAIELRHSAREAGVTVDYYGKLGVASRKAGIGIDETMAGMKKAHQSFESAALQGDVAEGLFLKSLGLTDKQIASGMDNAESMANMLSGKNLSGGQTAAIFGSYGAGKAAMGAGQGEGSFFDPTAGQGLAAARLKQQTSGFVTELGGAASQQIRAFMHGHLSSSAEADADEKEARDEQEAEIRHQAEAKRLSAAKERVNQVANPAEKFQAAMKAIDNMNFTGAAGEQGNRMKALAVNQARQEQLSAERPNLDIREGAEREWENIGEKNRLGGFADDLQGRRAQNQVEARMNAQLAPVRSNAQNAGAAVNDTLNEWDVADEAESRRKKNMSLPDLANFSHRRVGADGQLESDREMHDRMRSPEQTDSARKMGDQLTSYVEGMTSSGAQVGANGVNTVQGASMMMGAEYQMDQSQQTAKMVECLMKIAENTGHLTKERRQAVEHELGHRYNDPISGFLNMLGNH